MTRSLLGMHWIRVHPDGRDLSHVEAMQYKSVKMFEWHWSDRNACNDLLAVLSSDSYILARHHSRSEEKEDVWRDPEGTGTRHANAWAIDIANGECHLPIDRTFFLPANELDATNGDRNAIDIYTSAFLNRLKVHGLRGGGFNFSTGHPRTVDGTPNTKADYSVFERSHRAIVEGHHIAVLHIYGTGAVPCAPGHFDRLRACTWQDVEWVVGEFGVDEHVIGGGVHHGFHKYFDGRLNDYCAWLDTAIMGINDPRIHSYQVFTYDYSHPWSGFDVSVIRDALEGYQWSHTQQHTPVPGDGPQPTPAPVETLLPHIGGGAQPPAYVAKPAELLPAPERGNVIANVLNARSGPGLSYPTVKRLAYGDSVTMTARTRIDGAWWFQVGVGEWVHGDWIGDDAPQPAQPVTTPAPVATGIIEPRVAQAILKIESGGRTHGEDGRITARFEAHIFKTYLKNDALWAQHFRTDAARPWVDQMWRRSPNDTWQPIHTGRQADEYAVFEFAISLNREAAYQSISMGSPQVVGFNHAKIGYPSAAHMFTSFQDGQMQTIGFINFCLATPGLLEAMRTKDWERVATLYNGSGNTAVYSKLLRQAYLDLGD